MASEALARWQPAWQPGRLGQIAWAGSSGGLGLPGAALPGGTSSSRAWHSGVHGGDPVA